MGPAGSPLTAEVSRRRPASRSGWASGSLGLGGRERWPESVALVSPENLGRKPVRLAQEEGGIEDESGAGGQGPGRGRDLGSEVDIRERK